MRIALAFVIAVLGCYLLAATFASMHVLDHLSNMNIEIPLALSVQTIWHDWLGLTGIFLPVSVVAMGIGLSVAYLLLRLPVLQSLTTLAYVSAGAVALVAIHLVLNLVFDIHPIAVSRTFGGLAMQGLAGAVGGWLFLWRSGIGAR